MAGEGGEGAEGLWLRGDKESELPASIILHFFLLPP